MSEAIAPAFAFVLFAILAVAFAKASGQGFVNPVAMHAYVWAGLAILAVLTISDFQPMRSATWCLMFLSTAAVSLGSAHAWFYHSAVTLKGKRGRTAQARVYVQRRVDAAFWLGLGAMVLYVAIQASRPPMLSLVRSVGGIRGILNGAGLEYRYAYVAISLKQAESSFDGGGFGLALVGYLLFVPAMLTICLAGHFVLQRQWLKVALPLLVMAFYSIISLERATFLHALLICLASCYYHLRIRERQGAGVSGRILLRRALIAATLVCVVGTTIFVPLKLRDPNMTMFGTLDSIFEYVSGPLGALNVYVMQHPQVTPLDPHLGGYTFWGAASILLRLGVPVHLPANWLDFVGYQAHGDRLSNVYTWLIYFVLDFGWIGVFVVPYCIGLLSASCHYLVTVCRRRDLIAPLAIFMAQLAMSFFAFSLLRDLRFWCVMIFLPFIVRNILTENPAAGATRVARTIQNDVATC